MRRSYASRRCTAARQTTHPLRGNRVMALVTATFTLTGTELDIESRRNHCVQSRAIVRRQQPERSE